MPWPSRYFFTRFPDTAPIGPLTREPSVLAATYKTVLADELSTLNDGLSTHMMGTQSIALDSGALTESELFPHLVKVRDLVSSHTETIRNYGNKVIERFSYGRENVDSYIGYLADRKADITPHRTIEFRSSNQEPEFEDSSGHVVYRLDSGLSSIVSAEKDAAMGELRALGLTDDRSFAAMEVERHFHQLGMTTASVINRAGDDFIDLYS